MCCYTSKITNRLHIVWEMHIQNILHNMVWCNNLIIRYFWRIINSHNWQTFTSLFAVGNFCQPIGQVTGFEQINKFLQLFKFKLLFQAVKLFQISNNFKFFIDVYLTIRQIGWAASYSRKGGIMLQLWYFIYFRPTYLKGWKSIELFWSE